MPREHHRGNNGKIMVLIGSNMYQWHKYITQPVCFVVTPAPWSCMNCWNDLYNVPRRHRPFSTFTSDGWMNGKSDTTCNSTGHWFSTSLLMDGWMANLTQPASATTQVIDSAPLLLTDGWTVSLTTCNKQHRSLIRHFYFWRMDER